MRIFTEKALKDYATIHPEAKSALQDWATKVRNAEWTCLADIKKTFNSVDYVGNQRYVFNIKGNNYRGSSRLSGAFVKLRGREC